MHHAIHLHEHTVDEWEGALWGVYEPLKVALHDGEREVSVESLLRSHGFPSAVEHLPPHGSDGDDTIAMQPHFIASIVGSMKASVVGDGLASVWAACCIEECCRLLVVHALTSSVSNGMMMKGLLLSLNREMVLSVPLLFSSGNATHASAASCICLLRSGPAARP